MAHDINRVVLVGRLTRDVGGNDFAYTSAGVACASACVAVNRSCKRGDSWVEEVSFFDVTIWGKQAEALRPYLTKGKLVGVEGYLRQDRWEKDGTKFNKVRVVAETVQLLGGKSAGGSGAGNAGAETAPPPEDIPF